MQFSINNINIHYFIHWSIITNYFLFLLTGFRRWIWRFSHSRLLPKNSDSGGRWPGSDVSRVVPQPSYWTPGYRPYPRATSQGSGSLSLMSSISSVNLCQIRNLEKKRKTLNQHFSLSHSGSTRLVFVLSSRQLFLFFLPQFIFFSLHVLHIFIFFLQNSFFFSLLHIFFLQNIYSNSVLSKLTTWKPIHF